MGNKTNSVDDEALEIYFKQISRFPLLDFEEEIELSKQVQAGNAGALHKLVNANLRLVVKIARLYNTAGVSLMDIVQEGNMGLMHAAEKYDHKKMCVFARMQAGGFGSLFRGIF